MLTLASDTPSEHRFIGKREKEFIFEETKKSINIKNVNKKKKLNQFIFFILKKIPWTEILTSKACLSIFIAHFAHNWGNYLFLTQIPSFLKDVLHFDIKSVR